MAEVYMNTNMAANMNAMNGQPANGGTSYATVPEQHKEKVIKGTAKVDKPKLGKRLTNFLFSNKLDSMGNYLFYYIFGPSLKNLLWNLGTGALSMTLFGGNNISAPNMGGSYVPGYGYQTARRDPVPYNMMGQPGYGYQGAPGTAYAQPQPGIYNPSRLSINDISFDTKDDAWLVLDRMGRELARYGKVKVADFYTFAGITGQESNWTLQTSGWRDLSTAVPVMRTDGRWIIQFPQVMTI